MAPPEAGEKKYDETAASMIAVLKYGSGVPFYRLDKLQGNLDIPLPPSTQWGIVKEAAEIVRPAPEELIRQAAQSARVAKTASSTALRRGSDRESETYGWRVRSRKMG